MNNLNLVILQYWEITDVDKGVYPNGCSLHISITDRDDYVNSIYKDRSDAVDIPSVYNRKVGEAIIVSISDELYTILLRDSVIKLHETEMNNLLSIEDLILC